MNSDKKKEISQCLMDFCYVLNGICSTLKSDNKHKAFSSLSPLPALCDLSINDEPKWNLCVKNIRKTARRKRRVQLFLIRLFLIYILLYFAFYLFPLFAAATTME